MRNDFLDAVAPLLPIDFFTFTFSIPFVKKPFSKLATLPTLSELLNEEAFASLSLGWNEEGIYVVLNSAVPFQEGAYPNYQTGDSLELFFDTRDVKEAGFATGFCHHFVLLAQEVLGIQAQEVTHFRSEDTHQLCDPSFIEIETTFGRNHYQMNIFFPADTLHGFDPATCDRLGFTYKVNRFKGAPQHFTVSSTQYNIAQKPSLWATLKLGIVK